jgi:hypothetical protein
LGRGRWTAGEERGRPARGSYSDGAGEREGRPTAMLERERGDARTADASDSRKHEEVLGFLMALGLAWAPSRPT